MPNIKIVNPIEFPGWDDLLLSTDEYSFFHSSSWAKVLTESYGYKPLYLTVYDKDRLLGLIPFMEIKSSLTGNRGVALPFSDYSEPIIANESQFHNIFDQIIAHGRKAGWKYIELRGGEAIPYDITPSKYYYIHTLKLSENEDEILKKLRSSTKRNIKKAVREEVEVIKCNSLESIEIFYRLNCITRKGHGLPPQPYYFFRKVFDHIISQNQGFVMLAHYKNQTIAGAVYFHIGNKAIYKYGASDPRYLNLRANNLVMWEAIKWYCQNKYNSFCFGRTEHRNNGLLQFKSGWGAKQDVLKYYKYKLNSKMFINADSKESGLHNKVFNNMPITLLKIIGSLIYKHMG